MVIVRNHNNELAVWGNDKAGVGWMNGGTLEVGADSGVISHKQAVEDVAG